MKINSIYFILPDVAIQTLNDAQIRGLVYQARVKNVGEWYMAIQQHPLRSCSAVDERPFLQFVLNANIDGEMHNIIGWGHPELIFLLKFGPCPIFLDCTFSVVPKGFSQLLIIMMYSAAHSMYIPVFYVLLDSKKEGVYWQAIQQCICASDWKMEASTYTADFEIAIAKTMKAQFSRGTPVHCIFHLKQCWRRKLLEFGIPRQEITILLSLMSILTVIPIHEIKTKGVRYCRSKMDEEAHQVQYNKFWAYFLKTWLGIYDPVIWNIHGLLDENSDVTLINRTNNPLERFNRRLNDSFPSPHPTMNQFVDTIREISDDYVLVLNRIKQGNYPRPVHQPATIHSIPSDYHSFSIV